MTPSPFEIGRSIGSNIGGAVSSNQDRNAIDEILSQVMDSNDPQFANRAIGQILSRVSPERQDAALKVIQNRYQQLEQQNKLQRQRTAAKNQGYTEEDLDLPPEILKEKVKTREQEKRLQNVLNPDQAKQEGTSQPDQRRTFKDLSDEELINAAGVPGASESAKQELQRRQAAEKEKQADIRQNKKETAPIKAKIIENAEIARENIRNAENLKNILDQGGLTDPSVAALLDSLPLNLGQRFLSPNATTYRSSLINQYGALRKIFQGQTRVKEIELLEQKIPDLYLTDQQKRLIIDNNLDALQYDVLKEQAAKEVEEENPDASPLQFNALVNQKLSKFANDIINQQRSIIDEAEAMKDQLLDSSNPEHFTIMQQIMEEAGGDPKKALKIGHEKGYKFKGVDG